VKWKYWLMIFVALACVTVLIVNASAYDPFKWQICDALNMSGGVCDDWWEAYQGPEEEVEPDYYNKTEVDQMLGYLTPENYYNKTEIDNLNLTVEDDNYMTKDEFDNWTAELRDSIADVYAKKSDSPPSYNSYSSRSSDIDPMWVVIIVIVVGGACGFAYMIKSSKKQPANQYPNKQTENLRKIMEAQKILNKQDNKGGE